MSSETMSLEVTDIIVGDRVRRENRHIEQLAESIRTLGLLHPIVINSRHELIAGGRRLEAVKRIGMKEVAVRIVTNLDDTLLALKAERDENTCREPLTPTEMVELGRAIEAIEKPKAEERKQSTQAKGKDVQGKPVFGSGKFPEPKNKGDTRDKVGEALGVNGSTYERAKQVVEAAEEDPDMYGDLPSVMDEKSVHAAHQELKTRRDHKESSIEEKQKSQEEIDEGARFVDTVETLCRDMDAIVKRIKELASERFAYSIHIDSASYQVEAARKTLWQGRPAHTCPYCSGEGCKACNGTGRVKRSTYDAGREAMGDQS